MTTQTISKPKPSAPVTSGGGSWRDGLMEYVRNPSDPAVFYHDNDVVIVEDKFPKSEVHYLVIPSIEIRKFSDLNNSHVNLIKTMITHAKKLTKT